MDTALRSRLRDVPLAYVILVALWSVAAAALIVSTDFLMVGGGSQLRSSDVTRSQFLRLLLALCAATAPWVALSRRWLIAALLAFSGLVTLRGDFGGGAPVFHPLMVGTFLAVLGSAVAALWWSNRVAWTLALSSLIVPGISLARHDVFFVYWAGGMVNTIGWDAGRRWASFGLWVLGALVGLAGALALRNYLRATLRQREVERKEADLTAAASRVDERARIARDLHDVVAHRVSLIAVRAEAAPYAHPDLGESGRELMVQTAADARAALDELRGVLGVLHRSVDTPARAPQPTAEGIETLIADARSVGDVEVIGELPSLSDAAGNTAYRVVQEALTNARRHAPGAPIRVTFEEREGAARIEVSNPAPQRSIVQGRGLVGMRERVTLLGGALDTRHTGSRFVVTAVLPANEAEVAQ